jgi:hypothetical protein
LKSPLNLTAWEKALVMVLVVIGIFVLLSVVMP